MKRLFSILCVSALVGAFGGACSENAEPVTHPLEQQIAAETDEPGTVVSEMAAIGVAEKFFLSQSGEGLATRSASGALKSPASVQSIKADAGTPAMHVINYPGGGFAIISATRDYHPVLAYSDEGSFNLSDDMGPVEVWISETKESIRIAEHLDAGAKATIRAQWNRLEPADAPLSLSSAPKTRAPYDPLLEAAFNARVSQLQSQYGPNGGFYVMSLASAGSYFGDSSQYQSICNIADQYNSPLEYTIVGVKRESVGRNVGPLTTTLWHQDSPYNIDCSNSDIGCGPVAIAQIMRFHREPDYLLWDNMPDVLPQNTQSSTDLTWFLKMVGNRAGVNYPGGTHVPANKAIQAFESFGYTAFVDDYYSSYTENWLYSEQKPVYMSGFPSQFIGIPTSTDGHAWVCDGVRRTEDRTTFFVEFINTGSRTYSNQGYWPATNPGISSVFTPEYFHMNWGWGTDYPPSWHLHNDVNTPNGNYQYVRKNIYAEP